MARFRGTKGSVSSKRKTASCSSEMPISSLVYASPEA